MTAPSMTAVRTTPSGTADWLIPAALIALAFIPVVAGSVRLTALATGTRVWSLGPLRQAGWVSAFVAADRSPRSITMPRISVHSAQSV